MTLKKSSANLPASFRLFLALALVGVPGSAQLTAEQRRLGLESFEKVWTTVRDKHWEKNPGGLDWQAIHQEFLPRVEAAQSMSEIRAALGEMLGRLKETHFAILPVGVFDAVESADAPGDGSTGIDVRVLNGQAVVTGVDPGSPAERAGVKPGWQVVSVNGTALGPLIAKLTSDPAIHELALERAVAGRLTGPAGASKSIVFLDAGDRINPLSLPLSAARGVPTRFGNLPEMRVWFESKKLGNTGYIRFNVFLDLVRVMNGFGAAVQDCVPCDGLVIDLRGNPGGIGAMAMGMAGWLVDRPDQRLGTMYMRDTTLNFVINPRAGGFPGPVAILVDGSSASTSEIFAGGLRDLGRARVFGTHTAAAALPSAIERLPDGDGFQYAIANYISEGGKALEGIGITPDQEVKLTRAALLAGHDPVLDAALEWIQGQKRK